MGGRQVGALPAQHLEAVGAEALGVHLRRQVLDQAGKRPRPCMPKTQPPGTSTLPVIAGSIERARMVWMHFGVCSMAQPHSSIAGLARGEQPRRGADLLGGDPGDRLGPFGREIRTRSASSSKPCVQRATKGLSYSSSPMMTLSIASASASSVPGRSCSQTSAPASRSRADRRR